MPHASALTQNALVEQLRGLRQDLQQIFTANTPPTPDFSTVLAARWQAISSSASFFNNIAGGSGYLQAIDQANLFHPDDLLGIERQKTALFSNTQQFVQHLPANNMLLTGSRGTGKSSLIRACLQHFGVHGLRMIEVDKVDLHALPEIVDKIAALPYRFVLFCDDLSFEAGEGGYKELKSLLDGSLAQSANNVLLYASSNRRHLLPEFQHENQSTTYTSNRLDNVEIHPDEVVEEKISLSERFGLCLSFHPFNQEQYWRVVRYSLGQIGLLPELSGQYLTQDSDELDETTLSTDELQVRRECLAFALARGSRSGRVAAQFVRDWTGKALATSSLKTTTVAAGILWRDNHFLLATRPKDKSFSGYWEFPGGKCDALPTTTSMVERPSQALVRELHEELGLTVDEARLQYLGLRVHTYAHTNHPTHVLLHFFQLRLLPHEHPTPQEGQELCWAKLQAPAQFINTATGLALSPVLPTTLKVLRWL